MDVKAKVTSVAKVKPVVKSSVKTSTLKPVTIKSGVISNKPVKLWHLPEVLNFVGSFKLGSNRSKYLASFADQETTGTDLLAFMEEGKKNFVQEMRDNYDIKSLLSRRMYQSLHALSLHTTTAVVESKSHSLLLTHAHSRFTSEVDPAETPYTVPIYGCMDKPLMSLKKACRRLKGIVSHIDKIAGCAMIAAAHKCKGKDKNGLSVDERGAIKMYTQESPFYHALNKTLRLKDRTKIVPFFAYLKLLLTALAKLPRVKGSFWRGIKRDLHKLFEDKLKNAEKHYFWSFKSATLKLKTLENPMFLGKSGHRTLLNIRGFSGVKIEDHSTLKSEAEVLFSPGCCFTVSGVLNAAPDLWIVELTELATEFPLIS